MSLFEKINSRFLGALTTNEIHIVPAILRVQCRSSLEPVLPNAKQFMLLLSLIHIPINKFKKGFQINSDITYVT